MHTLGNELERAYMEGVHIWRVSILLVARDIYILGGPIYYLFIIIMIMKDKIKIPVYYF